MNTNKVDARLRKKLTSITSLPQGHEREVQFEKMLKDERLVRRLAAIVKLDEEATSQEALKEHLRMLRQKACQSKHIIDAINANIDDPERKSICVSMIESASVLADEIQTGLDRPGW